MDSRYESLSAFAQQSHFTRVEVGGDTYFVPGFGHDRPASESILSGRYHEPLTHKLVEALLRARPGNMVHAGTFFGDMLPSFSRKCPGIVYAFEPVLESYVLAKQCLEQNELSNVMLLNAALGSSLSVCHMNVRRKSGQHRGGSSMIAATGQPTALLPIDSLGAENLSIIQLDVEGNEVEALKGARRTIESCRPFLLLEDNSGGCPTYLEGINYRRFGDIPELSLWVDDTHWQMASEIARTIDYLGQGASGS